MKIMSFNVNQFIGNKKPRYTRDKGISKDLTADSKMIISCIQGYIKNFLKEDKDSVVILQEIPGKSKNSHELFEIFKEGFNEYKIILPPRSKVPSIVIGICNKDSNWEEVHNGFADRVKNFRNKIIELKHSSGLQILGVHMPIDDKGDYDMDKCKQYNIEFWNLISKYAENKRDNYFLIFGDLNVNYLKYKEFKEIGKNFNKLPEKDYNLKNLSFMIELGYNNPIPEGVTFTHGGTMIDFALLSSQIKKYSGRIDEDFILTNPDLISAHNTISDHNPIILEIF